MQAFQKILVPVDGSAASDRALDGAVNIASVFGSEIVLLYVSYFDGDTDSNVEMISWLPEAVAGSVNKASSLILGNAARRIPAGIAVSSYRKKGIPSQEIIKFAEYESIDLVVIGGRGLGVVEGFLLGSVSQTVLESAKCTVMVIK